MSLPKENIQHIEEQVSRLLGQGESAIAECLFLVGILAAHGDRTGCTRLLDRAKELNLNLDTMLTAQLRKCVSSLSNSHGEELGHSVAQAQALRLTERFLGDGLASATRHAAENVAGHADEVILDADAAMFLEKWAAQHALDPLNEMTLGHVAYPLTGAEMILGSAVLSPAQEYRVHRVDLVPQAEDFAVRLAEAVAYVQQGGRAPERFRRLLNTVWVPVEQPYNRRMSLRRHLSENWILSLFIKAPVPVHAVRWGHRPLLAKSNDEGDWSMDLKFLPWDERVQLGKQPLDVVFADGNRVKVN